MFYPVYLILYYLEICELSKWKTSLFDMIAAVKRPVKNKNPWILSEKRLFLRNRSASFRYTSPDSRPKT